jgi:hypothetical protein
VNWTVSPFATLAGFGVTTIDCKVTGLLTVSEAWPVTPLSEAVMVDVPGATAVASPELLMVATDCVCDAQVTWLVRVCVELSEYVPMAVNCCVDPRLMLGLGGDTEIDRKLGADEPTVTVPNMPPAVPSPLSNPWIEQ